MKLPKPPFRIRIVNPSGFSFAPVGIRLTVVGVSKPFGISGILGLRIYPAPQTGDAFWNFKHSEYVIEPCGWEVFYKSI